MITINEALTLENGLLSIVLPGPLSSGDPGPRSAAFFVSAHPNFFVF
jgi:hypothetical protein